MSEQRPPRQIEVSIQHATAPPPLDLLFGSHKESRAANCVAAGGHRLPERRVVLGQAGLDVDATAAPCDGKVAPILLERKAAKSDTGVRPSIRARSRTT